MPINSKPLLDVYKYKIKENNIASTVKKFKIQKGLYTIEIIATPRIQITGE